jgi:hypothetical protein
LKSLTLFRFFPNSIAPAHRDAGRMKLTLRKHKVNIEAEKESHMTLANSKDKDEQTQESARAAIAAYPNTSGEFNSSKQIRVRKGQHLDVDGVLARSFKDVKSISLAQNRQNFAQGEAS